MAPEALKSYDYWNPPAIKRHAFAIVFWIGLTILGFEFAGQGIKTGWVLVVAGIYLVITQIAERMMDHARRLRLKLTWSESGATMMYLDKVLWELPWSSVVSIRRTVASGKMLDGTLILVDGNNIEYVLPAPLRFDPSEFTSKQVRDAFYNQEAAPAAVNSQTIDP